MFVKRFNNRLNLTCHINIKMQHKNQCFHWLLVPTVHAVTFMTDCLESAVPNSVFGGMI